MSIYYSYFTTIFSYIFLYGPSLSYIYEGQQASNQKTQILITKQDLKLNIT